MSVDNDSRLSREPSGADPMAEHKRRARWRLVGSILIAGSVAAIAPFVLEEQARPLADDLIIDLPSRSSGQLASTPESVRTAAAPAAPVSPVSSSAALSLPAPPEPTVATSAPSSAVNEIAKAPLPVLAPSTPPVAVAPASSAKSSLPASASAPPPTEPVVPATETAASSAAEKIYVQVGAYARLESAKSVQARMLLGGHRVTLETIKVADGSERHRVRIGPFESREQATLIKDRARSQGYEAILVTL